MPGGQVLVSHLSRGVKHQDGGVRLVVVGPVHRVEPFLTRRVPEVDEDVPGVHLGPVPVQGQGVRGELLGRIAVQEEPLD